MCSSTLPGRRIFAWAKGESVDTDHRDPEVRSASKILAYLGGRQKTISFFSGFFVPLGLPSQDRKKVGLTRSLLSPYPPDRKPCLLANSVLAGGGAGA